MIGSGRTRMGVTAREAVEQAISDSTNATQISIHHFWMTLHELGFQVIGIPLPTARTDGQEANR